MSSSNQCPIVIGIDPGKTTGVVVARLPTPSPAIEETGAHLGAVSVLNAVEVAWGTRLEHLVDIFTPFCAPINRSYQVEAVVVESFHLYPDKAQAQIGSSFPSVQVIGAVEMLIHLLMPKISPPRIYMVPAGSHKNVAVLDDAHDKIIGSGSPHIKDAYQLCRYYCIVQRRPPLKKSQAHYRQQPPKVAPPVD